MARLSPVREQQHADIAGKGVCLVHRGKVRDTYTLDGHPNTLLHVASDGVSIFDLVLNTLVPQKGEVLTALTVFWARMLKEYGITTHLLSDDYTRSAVKNYTFPDHILTRALAVQKLSMFPIEFIARAHLTGSGLASYNKSRQICGHGLPVGLKDGDLLPFFLDTPTTKAEEGHDEHINADEVVKRYPEATLLMLRVFAIFYNYARTRGVIIADSKFEFGHDGAGGVILADEFTTPDSSRFWSAREWEELQRKHAGKAPTSLDKELVRQWGKEVETPFGITGLNKLDPANPEHLAFVHSLEVPKDVIRRTSETYRYIFWLLTGKKLEAFQRGDMGLNVSMPQPRVDVILGSRSDVEEAKPGLTVLRNALPDQNVRVHIASCHRNLEEIERFAKEADCDVIIAGAGMAAALPGVLDTFLRANGKEIPVIGVGFGKEGTEGFAAARLSIEQVPGHFVVTREDGTAYMGSKGLQEAATRVVEGELPPWKPRKNKPAEWNIPRGV